MGIFGSKKLKMNDADFGAIQSFHVKRGVVHWRAERNFFNTDIEVLMVGDKQGISETQKRIALSAFENEATIKKEAEEALKIQFENADLHFKSLETNFDLKAMSMQEEGFELAFQEKDGNHYYFNVHFENNKETGVSIDG